jgi:hypothetical protein
MPDAGLLSGLTATHFVLVTSSVPAQTPVQFLPAMTVSALFAVASVIQSQEMMKGSLVLDLSAQGRAPKRRDRAFC